MGIAIFYAGLNFQLIFKLVKGWFPSSLQGAESAAWLLCFMLKNKYVIPKPA